MDFGSLDSWIPCKLDKFRWRWIPPALVTYLQWLNYAMGASKLCPALRSSRFSRSACADYWNQRAKYRKAKSRLISSAQPKKILKVKFGPKSLNIHPGSTKKTLPWPFLVVKICFFPFVCDHVPPPRCPVTLLSGAPQPASSHAR